MSSIVVQGVNVWNSTCVQVCRCAGMLYMWSLFTLYMCAVLYLTRKWQLWAAAVPTLLLDCAYENRFVMYLTVKT